MRDCVINALLEMVKDLKPHSPATALPFNDGIYDTHDCSIHFFRKLLGLLSPAIIMF